MIAALYQLRKRRTAAAAIADAGGLIEYRDTAQTGLLRLLTLPRLALDIASANATNVLLVRDADDSTLATIAPLRNTESLGIFNSAVTDRGMQLLNGWQHLVSLFALDACISTRGVLGAYWLRHIQNLSIGGTLVDDGIWPLLQDNSQLTELGIGGTKIKDIGRLADHSNLRSLSLNSLPIAFDELAMFPCAENLARLYVNETPVNDETFRSLLQMPNLVDLAASDNDISDAAMDYVSTLSRLEELFVHDTDVSDDGIAQLSTLPKLRFLCICNTKITADVFSILPSFPMLDTVFVDAGILNDLSPDEQAALPFDAVPIDEDES